MSSLTAKLSNKLRQLLAKKHPAVIKQTFIYGKCSFGHIKDQKVG